MALIARHIPMKRIFESKLNLITSLMSSCWEVSGSSFLFSSSSAHLVFLYNRDADVMWRALSKCSKKGKNERMYGVTKIAEKRSDQCNIAMAVADKVCFELPKALLESQSDMVYEE